MGYIRHHAIVVTVICKADAKRVHAEAKAIVPSASDLSPAMINGYCSFFIPPDGSKEGWDESSQGDDRRHRLKERLRQLHKDGHYNDWVEVFFGEDNSLAAIVDHSRAESKSCR